MMFQMRSLFPENVMLLSAMGRDKNLCESNVLPFA